MADVFSERRRQSYARLDAVLRELDELDPPEARCQDVGAEGAALNDGVACLGSTPETCEGGVKRRRRVGPEESDHAASMTVQQRQVAAKAVTTAVRYALLRASNCFLAQSCVHT